MKKVNLIDAISDFLATDSAGDAKGVYHPEVIKIHLNDAFNQIIYNTWLNGKKFSDLGQLDAWSRNYTIAIEAQVGTNGYAFLPFAPVQLPDNAGIRQVRDEDEISNVFAPIEATASVVFAELDVSTMDSTPLYRLEQNNLAVGAGEKSHLLRLEKLPDPVSITSLEVMMIVPLESLDDYDDLAIPSGQEDSLIRQVIEIMAKKLVPDTANDAVIERK